MPTAFRTATAEDLSALRDLEREANLASLGHVFPPDRFPFPDDAVLARWQLVLEDPAITVLVATAPDDGSLVLLAAYDDTTLRHLAVRPDHWGRGLASSAIETVVRALRRRGCTVASLWCLEDNRRARRLYEHLGWRPQSERRQAPWPPHPTEMRYERPITPPER